MSSTIGLSIQIGVFMGLTIAFLIGILDKLIDIQLRLEELLDALTEVEE